MRDLIAAAQVPQGQRAHSPSLLLAQTTCQASPHGTAQLPMDCSRPPCSYLQIKSGAGTWPLGGSPQPAARARGVAQHVQLICSSASRLPATTFPATPACCCSLADLVCCAALGASSAGSRSRTGLHPTQRSSAHLRVPRRMPTPKHACLAQHAPWWQPWTALAAAARWQIWYAPPAYLDF